MSELYQFRVTKYDPKYRINGVYCKDEWTSYSDIGKKYNNKIFTITDYLKVEDAYLEVIKTALIKANVCQLKITDLEQFLQHDYCVSDHEMLTSVDDILGVSRDCLRETVWCKLVGDNFFIHFGYDYYMYIGCCIDKAVMNDIVSQQGLYLELIDTSPYLISDYEDQFKIMTLFAHRL